jgi:hypothetical protein
MMMMMMKGERLSDRDPDAFLFFFAVNARAALPLESPSSMLNSRWKFILFPHNN